MNVQREQILWFVLSILYLGTKRFAEWEWWNWWNCGDTHIKLLPVLGSCLKHQLSIAILVKRILHQKWIFFRLWTASHAVGSILHHADQPCQYWQLGWAAPLAAMTSAPQNGLIALISIGCMGGVPRKTFVELSHQLTLEQKEDPHSTAMDLLAGERDNQSFGKYSRWNYHCYAVLAMQAFHSKWLSITDCYSLVPSLRLVAGYRRCWHVSKYCLLLSVQTKINALRPSWNSGED